MVMALSQEERQLTAGMRKGKDRRNTAECVRKGQGRYMRIEAVTFWESTCGRKNEQWRWSEHQDTDNKQKCKSGGGQRREEQKKLTYFKISFLFSRSLNVTCRDFFFFFQVNWDRPERVKGDQKGEHTGHHPWEWHTHLLTQTRPLWVTRRS